ncbi:MAG: cytochrome b/b6 domain-containing protein [Thermoanaerobaculia bacterium]
MNRILVWDLPVRFLHWMHAILFIGAFAIANLASDEGRVFVLHAVAGSVIVFLVVLRIVWGVIGSRHARFTGFDYRPSSLVAYLRRALGRGPKARDAGHNPATVWFAIAMLLVLVSLGVTGFLLGRGQERFEEIHEVLAWTAAGLAASHVAGIVWHRLRQKECIATSMITGRKEGEPVDAIPSARGWAAGAFALLTAAWAVAVFAGWDPATGRIVMPLTGQSLQIGEREDEAREGIATDGERDDDDDDD